jgi:eukaryotic-like serine/threonine-protein kinase
MGLTGKILLFTGLIVVALVATTLLYTTFEAEQLARKSISEELSATRDVWETFQADRYSKLKLGIRVLGNDPAFKAAVANEEDLEVRGATVFDMLRERGQDLGADFFIATDADGVVIARSDRAGSHGEDLSADPLVARPLDEGEESATIWRQAGGLFHAVSVPMVTGGETLGVLVAGYGINEALAGQIRKLTQSDVAYLTQARGASAQLAVSSLGPKEGALKRALEGAPLPEGSAAAAPFPLSLDAEPWVAVSIPLAAAGGEAVGRMLALRSLSVELAGFHRFRNSLVLVSLVVMIAALGLAYVAARRITQPVRSLVAVVEKARDGSYSGPVVVRSADEIGVLARTFNSLLADLREKEQMITFLHDSMTAIRKSGMLPRDPTTEETIATTGDAARPTQPMPAAQPGALFAGRYEILSTLGKGGMGVVYRAQDQQLDEVVALKVLRQDVMSADPTLLERFKQELKLARRITHRCVLRTHDFGETGGTPYISMEFLEGVTLKDLILSKGALPVGVGLRIAKQICQGLEAAHRQGVIHRDIKPQNMLILPETGELKIMDFGIAQPVSLKAGASGLTTEGMVMGTPDYIPPEQAQGRSADFRSDIYALGVVLFETFTGKLPFRGDNVMKIVLAHIQDVPPRPRDINPKLPPELETVILRCLAKEPDQRYASAAETLKALTAVSSKEPLAGARA